MASPGSSAGDSEQSIMRLLVSHFVAAKKSLSTTAQVQRAQEIVQAAREALEECAVISARNAWLRQTLAEQTIYLQATHKAIENLGGLVDNKFSFALTVLDQTDAQLRSRIEVLRNRPVEPSLQPNLTSSVSPGSSTSSAQSASVAVNLYDFVDDAAPAALTENLRACIDRYHVARGSLSDAADTLYRQISEIIDAISDTTKAEVVKVHKPGTAASEGDVYLLSDVFRTLESHATEAADLLHSLVKHYDLCVTALRHTEGGGEAAAAELGLVAGEEGASAVLHRSGEDETDAAHAPMTDEELSDMIAVLEKDAAEVEDVVKEIRDRLLEMEPILSSLKAAESLHRAESGRLTHALKLLSSLVHEGGDKKHTNGATASIKVTLEFWEAWKIERGRILEASTELRALSEFYDGFAEAYDELLSEVKRRADVQKKLDHEAHHFAKFLIKSADTEIKQRTAFRDKYGDFLPANIWPGLLDPPKRYEVHEIQGAVELP